jgi:hypothetical protein
MTTVEPGDRPPERVAKRLAQPPGVRYADRTAGEVAADAAGVAGPLARAVAIAVVGGAILFLVGGPLSSTAGLIAVSALMGAGIGLTLAAATVSPRAGADAAPGATRERRAQVSRWSIGLAVGAVLVAAVATWLFARSEGGALDPLTYLWETFGLLVPVELVVAGLAAAWGASAGPVRG